jgi:hypothetical protein
LIIFFILEDADPVDDVFYHVDDFDDYGEYPDDY